MIDMTCLDKNFSTTKMLYKLVNDECLNEDGKIKEECKWSINSSKFNIKNSKLIGSPEDKFETMLFLPEGEGRKGEGGLRTKGYFKFSYENLMMNDECLMMNDKYGNKFKYNPSNSTFNIQHSTLKKLPLISIITVVYNGEKYLEETIQSVINQTYPNVEYIIIDGGSTDGTLDIIKKYEDKIDYWVSEKDKGIYDAMNKGIDLANGEWINFMNAGDFFTNKNIINEIEFIVTNNKIDLIYGDVSLGNGKYDTHNLTNIFQFTYSTICHQAIFAKKVCFLNNNFDVKFKWLADYKWLLNCFLNKNICKKYLNKEICYFDPTNEIPKQNMQLERLRERFDIGMDYFRYFNKIIFIINHIRLVIKFKYFWRK